MGSHQPIRKTVVSAPVAIPDKLYFRIGDVAKLCAVAPYVLRFWETEFTQLKPNKGGTGQRLYRKKDVEIALRIKTLLYEQGFTIPGARQVLKGDGQLAIAVETPQPEFAARPVLQRSAEPQEPADRGTELRLRAQLADLRDEMQALLGMLGAAQASVPAAVSTAKPPRPRLVLEPKPAARQEPAQIATLHLAQRDLFSAE